MYFPSSLQSEETTFCIQKSSHKADKAVDKTTVCSAYGKETSTWEGSVIGSKSSALGIRRPVPGPRLC